MTLDWAVGGVEVIEGFKTTTVISIGRGDVEVGIGEGKSMLGKESQDGTCNDPSEESSKELEIEEAKEA